MTDDVVIAPQPRRVQSWATGRHVPAPYKDSNGAWRCHECGLRLTRYLTAMGVRRLRHNPRGLR